MKSEEQQYCVTDMRLAPQGSWKLDYLKWFTYQDFYGTAQSVEADLCLKQDNAKLGLAINQSFQGGYMCQLSKKDGRQLLTLLRRGVQTFCEEYVYLDTLGLELPAGRKFHLKITCDQNTVGVELDGKELLRYEHDTERERFLIGECGYHVYPYMDSVNVENFVIRGEALSKPELQPVSLPEPYRYQRDQQLISGADAYVERLIYQFDRDPKLQAAMKVEELGEGSCFGFLFRKAPRTAYLKVGYDVEAGRWFLQDVPALYDCEIQNFTGEPCVMEENREYQVDIVLGGSHVEVRMDGTQVLCADGVRHCGYGKTGVFAEKAVWSVNQLDVEFSTGVAPAQGAISYPVDESRYQGSMEVEILGDGELIGISKQALYQSLDGGETFGLAPEEYAGVDPKGYYQSIIKLHHGGFLQVLLHKGSEIQISEDLKTWTAVGRVVPDEWVDLVNSQVLMTHVGTMTEIQRPDGGYRIFLPMNVNTYRKNEFPIHPKGGHDSLCFYSDDEGRTWKHSNWISTELESYNGSEPIDWAESKVIRCADGTLRLYCSRNNSNYFSYLESFDFGESWHNVGIIPQMQCARSSFGIAEDPQQKGTWYVAWVNDGPSIRGSIFSRTRLSLARTRDGKNWEFLTDVERFGECYPDGATVGANPLYQIVDPSVSADEKYVYVTWGGSVWASKRSPGTKRIMNDPSTITAHNELRPMFARFEKAKLKSQPWSAATVHDMRLLICDLTKEKW